MVRIVRVRHITRKKGGKKITSKKAGYRSLLDSTSVACHPQNFGVHSFASHSYEWFAFSIESDKNSNLKESSFL
jgi:hypothetical protein